MPIVASRDGVRLHYELHDYTDPWRKAPVLILQHGFGRSARFWFNLIPYLARFYRVVCPDLRGFGQSSKEFDLEAGPTIPNYVVDILTIADDMNAATFHYAGESFGGILGMVLSAEHPERVRSLSLLATPIRLTEQTQKTFALTYGSWQEAMRAMGVRAWADAINTAARFPPDADPGLQEWYAEEFAKSDVEVLCALAQLASNSDAASYLPRIKAPVLGIYPALHKFVTSTSGQDEELRKGIPHMRLVRMPSHYHMVWVIAPAACAEHMLHFMAAEDGFAPREP